MGGEIKRRKKERTQAEVWREERRRRQQTGAEGNNERALMLAVRRVRIFQTGFLSGPLGAGRLKPCCLSSLLSFVPCDFRHEYSVVRLRLSYMHVGAGPLTWISIRLYSEIRSRHHWCRCLSTLPEYHRIEHWRGTSTDYPDITHSIWGELREWAHKHAATCSSSRLLFPCCRRRLIYFGSPGLRRSRSPKGETYCILSIYWFLWQLNKIKLINRGDVQSRQGRSVDALKWQCFHTAGSPSQLIHPMRISCVPPMQVLIRVQRSNPTYGTPFKCQFNNGCTAKAANILWSMTANPVICSLNSSVSMSIFIICAAVWRTAIRQDERCSVVHKGEEVSRNNLYPSVSGKKHYADPECHDFTISIL